MKIKFSKRILSLFLSALMVVTSVPVFAVTTSAAAINNAYGLVGSYFTENVTDGVTDNKGVTWDASIGAAEFNGSSYLSLKGTPLSSVSSSTGFAVSVDVYKRSNDLSMNRIFDFNDGSQVNSIAFNAGSTTNNPSEQYMGIYKVNNTEVRYTASDDLLANAKDYAWHNILISVSPDGTYTCYVDGVARAVNAAAATPSAADIMNVFSSLTTYYIGRSIYTGQWDGFFNGYMRNLYLFNKSATPVDVVKAVSGDNATSALNSLKSVIAQYENVMSSGRVYTNMSSAYNAYVEANKVYDAAYYGGNTSVDVAAATTNLANALIVMQPWIPYTAECTSAADGSYTASSLVGDDEMSNVLYTYGAGDSSSYSEAVNSYFRSGAQFGSIVFLYSGSNTTIACPISIFGGSNSILGSRSRRLSSAYLSSSEFEINKLWHGESTTPGYQTATTKLVNIVNSQTDTSAPPDSRTNSNGYFSNTLYYVGTPTDYLTTSGGLTFNFYGSSGTNSNYTFANGTYNNRQCYIYIIDYSRAITAVSNKASASNLSKIVFSNYIENNGLADLLSKFDAVTSFNPNSYFDTTSAKTDGTVGQWATNCANAMKTAVDNLNSASVGTADSTEYQALRDAMDKELDPLGNTAMEAYAANGKGYDLKSDNSYAEFKTAYENAQAVMSAVANGGYADKNNASTKAAELLTALAALKEVSIAAPTISVASATFIGPDSQVTITTADGLQTVYTLAYDGGAEGAETTLDSAVAAITPFAGSTDYSTVTVRAHSFSDAGESKTVTATYSLLKQPSVSVKDGAQISASENVTIAFGNETPVGAIEYSYDNAAWNVYSGAFKPFADGSSAKTIFARAVSGEFVSAVTSVSITRNTAFTIASNSGTQFFDSSDENSRINVTTPETYSGEIKWRVTDENGNVSNYKTYNNETGIPASELSDKTVAVIEAYGSGDGVDTAVFKATLINKAKYSSNLIYQESFNDAQINNTTFLSSNGDGYVSTSSKATIESGAGTSTLSGTAISSYRNNVIKFAANNNGAKDTASYLTLENNPLVSTPGADIVAGVNGVTISYWRYIEVDGNVDTNSAAWNNGFMPGLSFSTDPNASSTSAYEYFKILSSGYITRCDKAVDGGDAGNGYIDIKPNAQDNTTHAAGNNRGYWVNVAVAIDPDSGVTIYTNGQPHETQIVSSGNYTGNNAELAKDLIKFLTTDTTKFSICDGTPYWGTLGDYYFDDIRVYTDCLTQVDVNNMYTDEYADVQTSAATSHDPTAVTVYTLTDGTQVGESYIKSNNIDASALKKEYYLFGTGMTIQKSDDAVNWKFVGDSQGRCGYQNQDLFGGVYTDKLAGPLAHAANDSGNAGKGAGQLVWAPHVIYNLQLGKWCYYAAASSWGSTWSAIFMGTSDSPTGPFTNIKTIYTSNGDSWNEGSAHPANAIDACVYYSADYSHMYMIYGSWSHGIYVKEMDPATGLAKTSDCGLAICYPLNNDLENAESGKTNDGGINNSVEGSYMVYEGGYYYLYVSYGSNGGSYSERVFRSTSPDSGFVDINGTSAVDHSAGTGVHGNQILSPFYLPVYNYVYASTGHNSVSKVYNANGELVTLNSVHARPIAVDEYNRGLYANADGELATMQIDISGNTTLVNMIAYTSSGWPVMFPLQYNGTDTATAKLTAYDIEGIYTNDNLRLTVNMEHSKCYNCYFLATSDTTGICYGTLESGESFSHQFTLSYGDDGTCYVDVATDSGSHLLDGVFAQQTKNDGSREIMYGMVNVTNGEHSWGYRSGNIPEADQESAGDMVTVDDVIYTHQVGDEYTLYGQEISDDRFYGRDNTNYGERVTMITTKYPYYIDTSFSGSIYCLSDEKRCREDNSLSGGDYNAAPLANDKWIYSYVENGVTKYEYLTNAEAYTKYHTNRNANIVKVYVIEGYVSNYFKYNESTGKYTEDGIELLITYKDVNDPTLSYGEYEFCYVMPNPGIAHTIQGARNQSKDWSSVDRRAAVEIFNRFPYSEGHATPLISEYTNGAEYGTDAWKTGTGKFEWLASFGNSNSTGAGDKNYDASTNTDLPYNYTSPDLIQNKFMFSELNEGVNPGSFGLHEFSSEDERTYFVTSNVVDVDYYVDYSNEHDSVITYGNDGKPNGYEFNMLSSNLWWNPKKSDPSNMRGSSYYVNNTGLDAKITSTAVNGGKYSADSVQATNEMIGTEALYRGGESFGITENHFNFLKDSSGNFNTGFATMDLGTGANNNWTGTVTFTGQGSVKKNTDTSSAENYANFIMEEGVVSKSKVAKEWYLCYNTYSYFNIGVSTCDKGAVRYFAENVLNKTFTIDPATGELTITGELESGQYTVSSYREYLDAVAEAYWFVQNSHNTTYNGQGENAVSTNGIDGQYEYTTAYDSAGIPIFNTTTSGADIFGTGTTTTDPVQAKIIQNVIDAYNNLFTKEDYTETVDQIENVISEDFSEEPDGSLIVKDEGNYTVQTTQNYENIVNFANQYITYYLDKDNPVDGEEYWRYAELTGSEYKQLLNLVQNYKDSLMPKVDATGDVANGGVADAGLSPVITDKSQILTDNESKVMWTGSIDNQEYTYSSYTDLQNEVAVANKLVADTAEEGRFKTNPEQSVQFMDETYSYATVDSNNYSDAQQSVIDETKVLSEKNLAAVDTADAYQNYNTAQYYASLADLDAYSDKGAAVKDNFKYGVIQKNIVSAYGDTTAGYPYVEIGGKVYKDASNVDTYTATVLNTLNGEFDMNSSTKLNLYDVTFNLYVDGVKVDSAYQLTQKKYGDIVEFNAPDAYTADNYDIAKWTIKTQYANTSIIKNNKFSISRVIQQNTDITLYITTKVADATKVVVQDYYGTLLDSGYVTLDNNGELTYTVNDSNQFVFTDVNNREHVVDVNQAANITFKEWTVSKSKDGKTIFVYQSYNDGSDVNKFFDLPNGAYAAENGTINDTTELTDVKAYTVLNLSTDIDDFLAWLKSDDSGNTWYVASYDAQFQTYARPARGIKFVAVTPSTISNYSINAEDVNDKVPFSFGSATETVEVNGVKKFRLYCDYSINPNATVVQHGVLYAQNSLPDDFTKGAANVTTVTSSGGTSDFNTYTMTTSVSGTKYLRSFVSYIYTLPSGEQIPRVSYGPIVMCDENGNISNVDQ